MLHYRRGVRLVGVDPGRDAARRLDGIQGATLASLPSPFTHSIPCHAYPLMPDYPILSYLILFYPILPKAEVPDAEELRADLSWLAQGPLRLDAAGDKYISLSLSIYIYIYI